MTTRAQRRRTAFVFGGWRLVQPAASHPWVFTWRVRFTENPPSLHIAYEKKGMFHVLPKSYMEKKQKPFFPRQNHIFPIGKTGKTWGTPGVFFMFFFSFFTAFCSPPKPRQGGVLGRARMHGVASLCPWWGVRGEEFFLGGGEMDLGLFWGGGGKQKVFGMFLDMFFFLIKGLLRAVLF